MIIRRERPEDIEQVHTVVCAAFARGDRDPVEAQLLTELRRSDSFLPALSFVAVDGDHVIGQVICTRARVTTSPALGLGPIAVRPDRQRTGVGSALMHAVLGAAEALDEALVALLGEPDFYARFGFRPAAAYDLVSPEPAWGDYFQARPLAGYDDAMTGHFTYADPFGRVA